ncbi:hypothetical protein CERSUDRAFT_119611 [Gelatoporia subvermispora B]|uniref:Uncharacterized protein n=1 Tax=Ceriporiopsis subvermispora (strain B) TaxID=914234 RepID=M2QHL2_CERS8|nr:hypothetical protein CERSUDRAFT_119611 [Gelatoporia subvermispora B]
MRLERHSPSTACLPPPNTKAVYHAAGRCSSLGTVKLGSTTALMGLRRTVETLSITRSQEQSDSSPQAYTCTIAFLCAHEESWFSGLQCLVHHLLVACLQLHRGLSWHRRTMLGLRGGSTSNNVGQTQNSAARRRSG